MKDLELLIDIEAEERKRRKERLENYGSQMSWYAEHPFEYMVERLRIKAESIDWILSPEYENHVWDGTPNPMKLILESLLTERRIGVESATGTGKTFLAAGIVLWFLECFQNSRVITTAPKEDQLLSQIWSEINKLYPNFGLGTLISGELRMKSDINTNYKAEAFVAGVKADDASTTKAQGYHAEHMLIILEETPGVPDPTITALLNTSDAPHNIVLAFGNPDHQLDNLHKFCTTSGTKHIRISARDHPNVVLNNPSFIPGATSRIGIQDKLNRYKTEDNPLYLSRVRGLSPGQSQDSLIAMKWCIEAKDRYDKLDRKDGRIDLEKIKGDWALGGDVANSEGGDKAAIAKGKGAVLFSLRDFQCPDSNQFGKRDVYFEMKTNKIKPEFVGIDSVGVGAGAVNGLKELNLMIVPLGGADAPVPIPNQEEEFNNLRSQMYWQLREDLRNNEISLPNDEELFADLVTPKWQTKNGKIVVESKEEIKKRLGHSPNKGDAVVYWNWVRHNYKRSSFEFI